MSLALLKKCVWLYRVIKESGCRGITQKEINEKWKRSSLNDDGKEFVRHTFSNNLEDIRELFHVTIVCSKSNRYSVASEEYVDNIQSWILESLQINDMIGEDDEIRKRVLYDYIPSGNDHLETIIHAMQNGHTVLITHADFWSKEPKVREVEPYFVKVFKKRWYLIAYDHLRNDFRTFGLDRITELTETSESFDYPSDFKPNDYFKNCFGITGGGSKDNQRIVLKVTAYERNYLRSLPLHHSQKEIETNDDYSLFEYHLSPKRDFLQEILLYMEEVEVVEPEELRNEVKEHIGKMWARYNK